MNALKACVPLSMLACAYLTTKAQSEATLPAEHAIACATHLESSFRQGNWNQYIDLIYAGAVSYYGGKDAFLDQAARLRSISLTENEDNEKIELQQMVDNGSEWQCVLKKTCQTTIDGRKAEVVSYLVGQSKDRGQTWKYVDVGNHSVDNVVYMMPDVSDRLHIPQRQINFERQQLASKN